MNFNEEFDELARRKLEERSFPFQEADWQDARRRIDAQRGTRGRALWIAGAGLLLLISSVAWFETRTGMDASGAVVVEQGKMDQPRSASASHASDMVLHASDRTAESTAAPVANNANASPPGEHAADHAMNAEAHTSVMTDASTAPQGERASVRTATTPNASMQNTDRRVMIAATAPALRQEVDTSIIVPSIAANKVDQPASARPQTATSPGEVLGNDAHQNGDVTLGPNGGPDVRQAAPPKTADSPDDTRPSPQMALAIEPGITRMTPPQDGKGRARPGTEMPAEQNRNDKSTHSGTGAVQPAAMETTASGDSASIPPAEIAADGTANAVSPAPDAAPPLVPDKAPWEISVIGGVFNSKTDYSGSNSAEWTGGISEARSIGVGTEFMHMGRHIGVGAGLHYGSYAEQLHANAIDATSTHAEDYWYLQPVDTTFLFITDTLAGPPTSYVGTSVDTTVNILTQGTHTITTTERMREARDQVNRVSYLEVPLLLDAHLVQGRWNIGLRGGPTFGLLTSTRGSVPDVGNEGYVEFSELPFREFMLGYTARAYIRYRFNAAWSVGIEPAARGQLMNSLGSGDVVRRASAKGIMLSLSYRLR